MSVKVDAGQVADAVGWAARAVPVRAVNPVLAGVRLSAEAGVLTVSGFDLEASQTARVTCEGSLADPVVVPGRLFADIVKALSGVVEITVEGVGVRVSAGRSVFRLYTLPVADFPMLPTVPSGIGSVGGKTFADAIRQVIVASSKDDALPTLTGVLVEADPASGVLRLVATDRYRLAMRTLPFTAVAGVREPIRVLVPGRSLDGYAKAVAGMDSVVFGSSGDVHGLFGVEGKDRAATTRLLDGEFPKFEALIPDGDKFVASPEVDVVELMESAKRASLVLDRNQPVRMVFSSAQVTLVGGADGEAGFSETLDCVDGPDLPVEIAFNPHYLAEGLAGFGSGSVRFGLVSSTRPALLTRDAVDGGGAGEFRYLLMPVRVSSPGRSS
jgi:DNA polymerase-3 subunit beta